ncbi:MAG: tetratricopeptide repeat protein, partial [bacterium]|nr:tetratricopeptide repeat protein [bacterium]
QRARVYVAQKRWRAAASDFSEVVAYESDWRKAQSGLAWSFHQQGKNERALAHALAAVQLAPSDYYAWDTLGRILLELDNFPDAISAFREALQEDPKHQKSFWYLMENHGFPLYNFDRA